MSTASDQHVDGLILSFARVQWKKVAMIIAEVSVECERNAADISLDAIADRIRHMVEEAKLEAQGNLSKWRHSEVRLAEQHSEIEPSD
jgi:hypothetical protein